VLPAASLVSTNHIATTKGRTSGSNDLEFSSLFGAALVQHGTSIDTIADRVASGIASAVRQRLAAGNVPQSDLDRPAISVKTAIAKALVPPGNGSAGTAARQLAGLDARFRNWIAALAREPNDAAGQQNVLSGKVLDAISAREPPARQQTDPQSPTASADAPAFTSAPLGSVASALAHMRAIPASSAASADSTPVSPRVTDSSATATSQHSAGAPDLLARMLVRAAAVDEKVNAPAPPPNAASSPTAPQSAAQSLAVRFEAAIASAATAFASDASSRDASAGQQGDSRGFAEQSSNAPLPATQRIPSQTTPPVIGASASMPAQIVSSQAHGSPGTGTAAVLNADAIVEQMVKATTLRTTQQGTSEIRLQLEPENLGTVSMKLTVQGSQITANVVAQNAGAGNALVSNQQQLARSLAAAGLTLSGFSVDVSGGNAGRDQTKDRTAGFGRRYVVHELNGVSATETPGTSGLGTPLLPGSNLELFNYLV
jgi:flagellar hook-length control protein FliK